MSVIKRIIRSHSKIKEILLLFLLGFFLGGILYFLFQKSYIDTLRQMDAGVTVWAAKEMPFVRLIFYSLYEHGKFFVCLWLLSTTQMAVPSIIVFSMYRGFCHGFLLSFFFSIHGFWGVRLFFCSLFPHVFLLIPMYLFFFQFVYRGRKEKRVLVLIMLSVILSMACFLEAYFNIPLMRSLYNG